MVRTDSPAALAHWACVIPALRLSSRTRSPRIPAFSDICYPFATWIAGYIIKQGLPVVKVSKSIPLGSVFNPDDFRLVVERIRSVLQEGTFQRPLPQLEPTWQGEELLAKGRPLPDFQRFHVEMDKARKLNTDMYFNFLCLSEEIGELGRELAGLWLEEQMQLAQGQPVQQARQAALSQRRHQVESELADCMAYLLKLANYAGVDLETAYLEKMKQRNQQ